MVALVHGPDTGESAVGGWQGIRQQLFGQKRERDAEDGLLTVITQLQTRLALATGAAEGPLRAPAVRAQALRAVQDGLNGLVCWHRDQIVAAQAVGWWTGPLPELARDVLAAVKTSSPLFEGAEVVDGAVEAQDVAHSVAQLRGAESDAFYNEALGGFVAMLEAVYVRMGIDAPTASTAASMRETWDVLVDELRALACPAEVAEVMVEPDVVEPVGLTAAVELAVDLVPTVAPVVAPVETPLVVLAPERPAAPRLALVIELARFRRFELVAC
jgi:hypothetical protein